MLRGVILAPMTSTDYDKIRRTHALQEIARNSRSSIINRGLILALLLTAMDVLLVAHLQQSSALAILRFTPPVSLFTGVFVNLASAVFFPIVIGLLTLGVIYALQQRVTRAFSFILGAFLFYGVGNVFLDESLTPGLGFWFVGIAVAFVLVGVGSYLVKRFEVSDDLSGLSVFVFFLGLACLVTVVSSNDDLRAALARPYISAEEITVKQGADDSKLVGYVLDVDVSGQWTTLLLEHDRTIRIIASDSIAMRTVCRPATLSVPHPRWSIIDTPPTDVVPVCEG